MYEQLLADAGYEPTSSWSTPATSTCGRSPSDVDVVPEYVGGIVNFLNARANGADGRAVRRPATRRSWPTTGQRCSTQAGITLLDVSEATDTNAFFVTEEYSEANGVTKLSDLEGKSGHAGRGARLRGPPRLRGRPDRRLRHRHHKVLPLGYASDQTYQSVLDGESELGETCTTDGTLEAQGLVRARGRPAIQPAQNLVPAVGTEFLAEQPRRRRLLNALMAALTTEKLTELNGRVAVDREQPADVARVPERGPALRT